MLCVTDITESCGSSRLSCAGARREFCAVWKHCRCGFRIHGVSARRGHLCCTCPHLTLSVRCVTQQNLASLSLTWWRDTFGSPAMGVILCTTAAGCFSLLFHESSFKRYLPLLFISIILLVAVRFGTWAGVVGTLLSSVVFAMFLFAPQSSLMVSDLTARSNLIWMVVVGLILSYFFAATPPNKKEVKN